jgi:hypothetical protein
VKQNNSVKMGKIPYFSSVFFLINLNLYLKVVMKIFFVGYMEDM